MTYWLTESAFIPMITGIFLTILFLGLGFQSREKVMYKIALGIALLTMATVVCERMIVTDQEKVETLLNDLSVYISTNDTDGILRKVKGNNEQLKSRITNDMNRGTFTDCRVMGTNYFEGPTADDSSAEICFAVAIRGSIDELHRDGEDSVRIKFTLYLDKVGDNKWDITDYKYELPMAGMR